MRLGLGAKFTLTVLTILSVTMAANTLYFLNTASEFHEKQLIERGRALGRLISLVSPVAVPGCPPTPLAIMQGILTAITAKPA